MLQISEMGLTMLKGTSCMHFQTFNNIATFQFIIIGKSNMLITILMTVISKQRMFLINGFDLLSALFITLFSKSRS